MLDLNPNPHEIVLSDGYQELTNTEKFVIEYQEYTWLRELSLDRDGRVRGRMVEGYPLFLLRLNTCTYKYVFLMLKRCIVSVNSFQYF